MPKFEIGEQVIVDGITHIVTGRQKDPRGWRYEVEDGTWHFESALRSKKNAWKSATRVRPRENSKTP